MSGVPGCPACGHAELRSDLATPRVIVERCPRCGHRTAKHLGPERTDVDYHEQTDDPQFLRSLERTRRSQARLILERLRAAACDDSLLDFGAGRAWFVQEALAAGMRRVGGADTSHDSVTYLRDLGVDGIHVDPPGTGLWRPDLSDLSFRPRVLTLLDVIEHFPPTRLVAMLSAIVSAAGDGLELVVIKVPTSEGALYRTARLLARARVFGPIEQLYQVGTFPPHWSYFTRTSLLALLDRCGLRVVDELRLLDFDPATFGSRVSALHRAPAMLSRGVGIAAATLAARTSQDATAMFARPSKRDT